MAARFLISFLLLGELILPRNNLLHQSLGPARGMARRKCQSTEKGKKVCEKNQFCGACFQSKEPHRREQKKQKSKRCRDPCKDGACRPGK